VNPSDHFSRALKGYLLPLLSQPGLIGAEQSIQMRPSDLRAGRFLLGLRANQLDCGWLEQHLLSAGIPQHALIRVLSDLDGASAILFALEERIAGLVEYRCYVEWPLGFKSSGLSIRGYKWSCGDSSLGPALRITEYSVMNDLDEWTQQVVDPLLSEPLAFWVVQTLKRLGPFVPGDLMRVQDMSNPLRRSGCLRAERPALRVSNLLPSIRLLMLEWNATARFVAQLEEKLQAHPHADVSWLAFGQDERASPFMTLYCRFNPENLRMITQARESSPYVLRNAA
jgi:hypothetical protein